MERNEQWLKGGDCKICRKQKYCSKECKAAKYRQQTYVVGLVARAMAKAIVNESK